MFERFTRGARGVVVQAQQQARDTQATYIGTEHLLLGLLAGGDGLGAAVLRDAGLTLDVARSQLRVEMRIRGGAEVSAAEDARALEAIGIDLPTVRARLEDVFGPGAWERAQRRTPHRSRLRLWGRRPGRQDPSAHRVLNHLPFTPRAKEVLELSLRESRRMHHGYIGTEHLLLALLREGRGLGARVLAARQIDADDLRRRVLAALDQAA